MATKEKYTYAEVFGKKADEDDRRRRAEKKAAEQPVLTQQRNEWIVAAAKKAAAELVEEYQRKRYRVAQELSNFGVIMRAVGQFLMPSACDFPVHIDGRFWSVAEMARFGAVVNETLRVEDVPLQVKVLDMSGDDHGQKYSIVSSPNVS